MKKYFLIVLLLIVRGFISDKASMYLIYMYDPSNLEYNYITDIYNSIVSQQEKPSYESFYNSMKGYLEVSRKGELVNRQYLTIIDYSLSSCKKRLWVIDLAACNIKYNTLVAHGVNTGEEYAEKFSNRPRSNMSSLGFFLTGDIYYGKHGLSLRLDGIEEGINNNAMQRAIVMHPAKYVSEDYIRKNGRLGRSFGCPALPVEISKEIIENISGQSILYIHFTDTDYKINSGLLK